MLHVVRAEHICDVTAQIQVFDKAFQRVPSPAACYRKQASGIAESLDGLYYMRKQGHFARLVVLVEEACVQPRALIGSLIVHLYEVGEGLSERQSYHGGALLVGAPWKVQGTYHLLHGPHNQSASVSERAVEVEYDGLSSCCHYFFWFKFVSFPIMFIHLSGHHSCRLRASSAAFPLTGHRP